MTPIGPPSPGTPADGIVIDVIRARHDERGITPDIRHAAKHPTGMIGGDNSLQAKIL